MFLLKLHKMIDFNQLDFNNENAIFVIKMCKYTLLYILGRTNRLSNFTISFGTSRSKLFFIFLF